MENCWAIAGLQYFEGAVQAQTGTSYRFIQDQTFWYEIFKQRLLSRWKIKAELGGGLADNNIFTDFGFPEAIPSMIKNSKLAFYDMRENLHRKPGQDQFNLNLLPK